MMHFSIKKIIVQSSHNCCDILSVKILMKSNIYTFFKKIKCTYRKNYVFLKTKKKCRIQQTKVEVDVRLKIPFVYAGIPAAAHPKLFKKKLRKYGHYQYDC